MGKGRAARVLPAATLGAVLGLVVFAGRGPAGASPSDFTGHWTGAAQQEGQPANPLMTDFTSTGPKTFTGTVTVVRRVRRGLDGTLIVVVRNLAPRTTYEIVVQGVRIGT